MIEHRALEEQRAYSFAAQKGRTLLPDLEMRVKEQRAYKLKLQAAGSTGQRVNWLVDYQLRSCALNNKSIRLAAARILCQTLAETAIRGLDSSRSPDTLPLTSLSFLSCLIKTALSPTASVPDSSVFLPCRTHSYSHSLPDDSRYYKTLECLFLSPSPQGNQPTPCPIHLLHPSFLPA